jgi:hypothetical protein
MKRDDIYGGGKAKIVRRSINRTTVDVIRRGATAMYFQIKASLQEIAADWRQEATNPFPVFVLKQAWFEMVETPRSPPSRTFPGCGKNEPATERNKR